MRAKTQAQVAHGMGITQSFVSKLERAECELTVDLLRAYIESLCGSLQIEAVFDKELP